MAAFAPPAAPSASRRTVLPARCPRRVSSSSSSRPHVAHRRLLLACAPRAGGEAADLSFAPNDDSDVTAANGFSLRELSSMRFEQLDERDDRLSRGGAYAIRGEGGVVMYMGYSKNVAAKLRFHQQLCPEGCVSFQVYIPPLPQELISPEMLEGVLEYWVRETGAVPKGNTVDRALWENPNAVDRKSDSQIPVRERSSPSRTRRASRESSSSSPTDSTTFSDAFRATATAGADWSASDDDYVQVDVDPFDPFSASKRRAGPRVSWQHGDEDDDQAGADWIPILALMGVAGLIWLIGILGNALPAATPSMGM